MKSVPLVFMILTIVQFQLSAQCTYLEKDGLLIIEAENLSLNSNWKIGENGHGYSGSGYIFWSGHEYFQEPGNGQIDVSIKVKNPGRYRIQWRSKVGEGADFTEFNDTWLRFLDASDYYGLKEGKKVFPKGSNKGREPVGAGKDGWFKIFLTGVIDWTFSTNTSDKEDYQVYVEFDKPGIYLMQLSARSSKHLIDRIVLFQENNEEQALDLNTAISDCDSEAQPKVQIDKGKHFVVEGEAKVWHNVTCTFDGPNSSITSTPNPFSDYLLAVRFRHSSGKEYNIEGFYAACGNAANTSCVDGNKWRVNFIPDRSGIWSWEASFLQGEDVAIGKEGKTSKHINGAKGQMLISDSDKTGKDLRASSKGKLRYVGQHYLRFSGTNPDYPNGNWFIKAGADATENTLDYIDFDNTPNRKGLTKHWGPHSGDYDLVNAKEFTWGNGKGKNILGALKYLSDQRMNAFSFLTFSLAGDDQNVFPHQLKVDMPTYGTLEPKDQWVKGVYHDRFDCAKLDQWEKVFSYADQLGMFQHFKLAEEENETLMDGGDLGRERKLYYREIVARFGHHLAINWNLGEENGYPIEPYMTDEQRIESIEYIKTIDPYQNHRVIHTRPDLQDTVYNELLGNQSELTGASLQCVNSDAVHTDVLKWLERSDAKDKKWVVANDEQGTYKIGVSVDEYYDTLGITDNRKEIRHKVLWGTLMAGGAGVEYYYGYQTGCGDLDCQNHRTRSNKWADAASALLFFNNYLQPYFPHLSNLNTATANDEDYVLGIESKIYAVYLPYGGKHQINLPAGNWVVQWFNPRSHSAFISEKVAIKNGKFSTPDHFDWVALITNLKK